MDIDLDLGPITEGRPVALSTIVSWALWVVGLVLVLLELFGPVETGDLGVAVALGGLMLRWRQFCIDLETRERTAFEIGVKAARRYP